MEVFLCVSKKHSVLHVTTPELFYTDKVNTKRSQKNQSIFFKDFPETLNQYMVVNECC